MKNKEVLICFVLLLSICMSISVSSTYVRQNIIFDEQLRIDLVRYDPSPIHPGGYTDVLFEIRNIGDEEISNIEITLVDGFPFSIASEEERTVKFSTLKPSQTTEFHYTIWTAPNVEDGDYSLSLQYYSTSASRTETEKFTVPIQQVGMITKTFADTQPEIMAPGERAKLTITIENSGIYAMRDVKVKLDLTDEDLPLAPIGITTEQTIAQIAAQDKGSLTFNIIVLPDAKSNVYKVPLKISYYDELGTSYNQSDLVGAIIGATPELDIGIESSKIYGAPGTGDIVLKFVNKGTTDIKFLNVKLLDKKTYFKPFRVFGSDVQLWETTSYKILSPDTVYIGDIDSDDYETASFKLTVEEDPVILPFLVEYKDANNKDYSEERNIELKIYSEKQLGMEKGSMWEGLLFLIIIILLIQSYRNWRKKNEGKKIRYFGIYIAKKLKRIVGLIIYNARRAMRKIKRK